MSSRRPSLRRRLSSNIGGSVSRYRERETRQRKSDPPSRSMSYSCAMERMSSPSLASTVRIMSPLDSRKVILRLQNERRNEQARTVEETKNDASQLRDCPGIATNGNDVLTHPVPGSGRSMSPCQTTAESTPSES